jgi:hypothetical protein
MPGGTKVVRERTDARRQPLCVMEQQDLGHA